MKTAAIVLSAFLMDPQSSKQAQKPATTFPFDVTAVNCISGSTCLPVTQGTLTLSTRIPAEVEWSSDPTAPKGRKRYMLDLKDDWTCVPQVDSTWISSGGKPPQIFTVTCIKAEEK